MNLHLHDQRMKQELYERQGGRCNAPCKDYGRGLGISLPIRLMHNDHIDSKGPDRIENRQLLCSHCNQVKGDRGMAFLLEYHRKKWAQMELPIFSDSRIDRRQRPTVDKKPKPRPLYRNLPVVLELF